MTMLRILFISVLVYFSLLFLLQGFRDRCRGSNSMGRVDLWDFCFVLAIAVGARAIMDFWEIL